MRYTDLQTSPAKRNNTFFALGAAALLSVSLTACQTSGSTAAAPGSLETERSAQQSAPRPESLHTLDALYKSNSEDPDIATRYARALREDGRLERASMVLAPFARDQRAPHAESIIEFASIQAAMGNYELAEDLARDAVKIEPESGRAYHVLGIALDAQGHHKQAEVAFRKAIEHWDGEPSSLLNNLGLNLASQGFIDDALETLRRAQALAPERIEIERNIRIISALQYTPPPNHNENTPTPPRKPAG